MSYDEKKETNQVPDGWRIVKLSNICDLRRGLTYKSSDYCDGSNGIVFLTLNCVEKGGGFNKEGIKYYKGNYKEEHLVEVNDIIIANTDLVRVGEVVGAPIYVPYIDDRKTCMSMDLSCLKFDETEINKTFAYYFLQMHETRKFIKAYAEGSTVLHLDLKGVKKLPVSLPPLPEQHKIAEILSTVDEAIEKTNAIIQETQQLKKGLIQKLFTEGIGHTRFKETKIGRIPEEWEVVRFNQCLQKTKQKDPTKKPDEKFTYIDVSAVSNEFFKIVESKTILGKDAPSRARKGIKTGDTIYATVRPYLRRVAFVPSELDGEICSTGYCVLRPKSEEIFHRFVFQLMLTHRVNEYLESLQAGTSYPAISDSDVYQMLIPKPSLPEQQRIAEILSEVDARIETEEAYKAELEQLKRGLMQVLLTGKVRVKV